MVQICRYIGTDKYISPVHNCNKNAFFTESKKQRQRERYPAREPERMLERESQRDSLWLSLALSGSLWLSLCPDLLTKPLHGSGIIALTLFVAIE